MENIIYNSIRKYKTAINQMKNVTDLHSKEEAQNTAERNQRPEAKGKSVVAQNTPRGSECSPHSELSPRRSTDPTQPLPERTLAGVSGTH